jgi:hypothetical protein
MGSQEERSQNATQSIPENAPKMRHGGPTGTLPKCDTKAGAERSQNATRNAPKTQHQERSQNATKIIINTSISKTSIENSNNNPAPKAATVAVVEDALLKTGFGKKAAREIAFTSPAGIVLEQIALLPKRNPTKNPLGMLRRAIEENWPPPAETQTTDVGSSGGKTFAANFYAGYHRNSEKPVSDPSPADSNAAEQFVARILDFWPDPSQVGAWGRQFGGMVADRHGDRRQSFPALRPAIQRHGDDFYARLHRAHETERKQALERAHSAHYHRFESAYLDYLQAELARNEAENTKLFQAILVEEAKHLKALSTNRFGLNVKQISDQYLAGRLERFQQILVFEEGHGVLDFWQWDKVLNTEPFNEANV